MSVPENAIILDLRTPMEYAMGHLEGVQMIDFNGGELAAALPSLDPNAKYWMYCRSGGRVGRAILEMQAAGFTDLTNLGGLEQAAEITGLPIVR